MIIISFGHLRLRARLRPHEQPEDRTALTDGQRAVAHSHDNLPAGYTDWKDPVNKIIAEWRTQGEKGRYEAAMWRAAGLEPP